MGTVLCNRRPRRGRPEMAMRRDRWPGGRHATPEASDPRSAEPRAPDDRPADRSPPEPMSPLGVPHHADLFSPGDEPSAADADEESFQTLIEQHREALLGYVLRLTGGDTAEAECVVKETFYRASQEPSRLVQRTSSVRPWLVLLARTAYQDGQRRAPATPEPRPDEPSAVQAGTTVVRAMDNLSRVHREILVELFYRGTSLEEAAQARGVGVDTVKSRLYYAMRALRIVLDQQVADREPDHDQSEWGHPDR
jgi:RNA polymerase sigma-70 factor (ECF subfamily)